MMRQVKKCIQLVNKNNKWALCMRAYDSVRHMNRTETRC